MTQPSSADTPTTSFINVYELLGTDPVSRRYLAKCVYSTPAPEDPYTYEEACEDISDQYPDPDTHFVIDEDHPGDVSPHPRPEYVNVYTRTTEVLAHSGNTTQMAATTTLLHSEEVFGTREERETQRLQLLLEFGGTPGTPDTPLNVARTEVRAELSPDSHESHQGTVKYSVTETTSLANLLTGALRLQ